MAPTITAEHTGRPCEVESASPLHKLAGIGLTLFASLGTYVFFAIQGVLLARLLGPEMRGAFAAAILFPQALLYLGLLGAPELFARYAANNLADAPLRRSAALYGLFASLLTMTLCVAFDFLFLQARFQWVLPWAILCAISLPFQQVRLAVQAIDHGQRNLNRYNQDRLLSAAAFPVFLVLGWLLGLTDLQSICVTFVLSQAAALLLTQWGMRGSWLGTRAVPLSKALHDGRSYMAAWLSTELLERLDMCLILVLISSEQTLGFYSSAVPIASLMIIVPNAIGLYAFNRGARADDIPSPNTVWRYVAAGLMIQIVSAIILAALLPVLVVWMYGSEFLPTVTFAWLLLPAGICRGLLQAADSFLRGRGKPTVGIKARLVGVAILVAVSLVGAASFESFGVPNDYAVPIGLSIAQAVCLALVVASVLRDVREFHNQRSGVFLVA